MKAHRCLACTMNSHKWFSLSIMHCGYRCRLHSYEHHAKAAHTLCKNHGTKLMGYAYGHAGVGILCSNVEQQLSQPAERSCKSTSSSLPSSSIWTYREKLSSSLRLPDAGSPEVLAAAWLYPPKIAFSSANPSWHQQGISLVP